MKGQPKTPEHKAKIAAALRAHHQRPDSHLRLFQKRGPEHPSWKNGFKRYRQEALRAYGEVCQKCGATQDIIVHHRDGNRQNNVLANLQVLCRSCHGYIHDVGRFARRVTHCSRGHEYRPETTLLHTRQDGRVSRSCKLCMRINSHEAYLRAKEERHRVQNAAMMKARFAMVQWPPYWVWHLATDNDNTLCGVRHAARVIFTWCEPADPDAAICKRCLRVANTRGALGYGQAAIDAVNSQIQPSQAQLHPREVAP